VLGVPLKGEFGTVIGPSGSGKSTLYDILAGLEEPSAGAVELDGPQRRQRAAGPGRLDASAGSPDALAHHPGSWPWPGAQGGQVVRETSAPASPSSGWTLMVSFPQGLSSPSEQIDHRAARHLA